MFKKRKEKKKQLDEAFDEVVSEIQKIEDWDNPKKVEHYILDSCEQIIASTKEIESQKAEYRVLTNYLMDIRKLKELPDKEYKEIYIVAKNIEELAASKKAFKDSARPLNDDQFILISENEDVVPDTILRMQKNEKYQLKVEKEMRALEAQKSEHEIERDQILHSNRLIRKLSVMVLVTFASFMILALILKSTVEADIGIFLITMLFFAATGIFIIYIRFASNQRKNRGLLRNLNQTIGLLNVVRMKYANVTRALEYEKEKYQVANSYELNYLWEGYLETVRQQEQYASDNDDFEYFNRRLLKILNNLDLFDKKIWLNQVSALVHPDIMQNVNHDLVVRRQKLRDRIAEETRSVKSERDEIDRLMKIHNYYEPEIIEIITSVDKLCGLKELA